jgi:hypothetical protein
MDERRATALAVTTAALVDFTQSPIPQSEDLVPEPTTGECRPKRE